MKFDVKPVRIEDPFDQNIKVDFKTKTVTADLLDFSGDRATVKMSKLRPERKFLIKLFNAFGYLTADKWSFLKMQSMVNTLVALPVRKDFKANIKKNHPEMIEFLDALSIASMGERVVIPAQSDDYPEHTRCDLDAIAILANIPMSAINALYKAHVELAKSHNTAGGQEFDTEDEGYIPALTWSLSTLIEFLNHQFAVRYPKK